MKNDIGQPLPGDIPPAADAGDPGPREPQPAKVYLYREIAPANLVKICEALGRPARGKVAVKLSTGEPGGHHYLQPELIRDLVQHVGGTIVECNTAYGGGRARTEDHLKAAADHGFAAIAPVDIMDEEGELELSIDGGKKIQKNYVGNHLANYDSMLVLSHFKGHPMGGFGGALKNISIGIASSHGKAYIHGVGVVEDFWNSDHDSFLESMADAAKSIVAYFDGKMAFINIMRNMSVDCDCCAMAEDPKIGDIGILASLDPVALDQACLDLVYASDDPGKAHLIERIESRNGIHTVEAAAALGIGSRDYALITL